MSFQDGWEQRHNLIAYWRSKNGGIGVLQHRYLRDVWSEVDVDLSAFKGQPVFITLVTDARGSGSDDSAVWTEPRLEAF